MFDRITCWLTRNHHYNLARESTPNGMRGVCLDCGYTSPGWHIHPSKQERADMVQAHAEIVEAELRLLGGG